MVKNFPLGPSITGTAHTEHKMRMVSDNVDNDNNSDVENYNANDGDRWSCTAVSRIIGFV
jgi:succinate dehydrogenase/fumarate reductase-like Fe-S protein